MIPRSYAEVCRSGVSLVRPTDRDSGSDRGQVFYAVPEGSVSGHRHRPTSCEYLPTEIERSRVILI